MKLAFLAGILSMFLISSAAVAEDVKDSQSTGAAAVTAEKEKPGVMHQIDTNTGDDSSEPVERPEDYEGQELPSYQSYDPNTGMTDNTQSDAAGNLN